MRYLGVSSCGECPYAASMGKQPWCKKGKQHMEGFDGMPDWCPLVEGKLVEEKIVVEEPKGGPADPSEKPIDPETVKKVEGKKTKQQEQGKVTEAKKVS